jgi:multidrug transporter EmrE-like cation transporter
MIKFLPAIIISVLLSAFAQVFLRKGMLVVGPSLSGPNEITRFLLSVCFNGWIIAGVTSYMLSFLVWLYVLAKVEVSWAYPFQSLAYIVIAIISFYTLGESLTPYKIGGIAIICIGVIVLSLSPTAA